MQEQQKMQTLQRIQELHKQIMKTCEIDEDQHESEQQLKNQQIFEQISNNMEQVRKFNYLNFKDINKMDQCLQVKKKNKNEKKKQRKKRIKMHKFKIKQQKIQQLKLILAEIYSNNQRMLVIKQSQILSIIQNLPQQQIFFQILNHAINQYIDKTAESIWYRLDQYINCDPEEFLLDCPEQWPEFFKILINELYLQYDAIRRSSINIEKLIEIFIKYYSNKSELSPEDQNYNLTKNTFNHLISSNVFFERFMKSCKNFLTYTNNTNNPDESTNKQSMQKLKELMTVFDPSLNPPEQECEETQQVCLDSQNSTQQETNIKQDHKIGKKKRKRNRKKDRSKEQIDAEMICTCEDQQIHFQKTLEILDKLKLSQNRISCDVSQIWIRQMENKFKHKK